MAKLVSCMLALLVVACGSDDNTSGTPGAGGASGGAAGAGGTSGAGTGGNAGVGGGSCAEVWLEDAENPLIHFQDFGGLVWNDPWVRKENAQYRMWTTSGAGGVDVNVYELSSSDGKSFAPASTPFVPQLVPGPDSWDAVAVETPSVVELGGTYHMYYTAVPTCANPPGCTYTLYEIGHASSPDGVTWTKSSAPVIQQPAADGDWGSWGIAEPGATVKDGVIYLYYAMVRCRGGAPCAPATPAAERAIGLATSTDGESFDADPGNPILVQSANYPASELYEGYSTPAAAFIDGQFHLFYDVAQTVDGAFRQVALAHATSSDGKSFVETPNILERAPTGWTSYEIRAPVVVDEGDQLTMWFAGNNGNSPTAPGFQIGIGRATMQKCGL
jgi:hypothetical protein